MTFEKTRQILETRMFNATVNPSLHPYSTQAENIEGVNRLASITSKKEIVAVQSKSNGIFEIAVKAPVFRDGQQQKQPSDTPFVLMFINDSGNRTVSFNKTLKKSSGSARFTIYVPRELSNPVRTSRLIADAIDLRMGFQGGSAIADAGRFPSGQVGGTLFTQSGTFNKVSDDDNGFMSYTLDFIYDYYN